jgi:hypothetical protein
MKQAMKARIEARRHMPILERERDSMGHGCSILSAWRECASTSTYGRAELRVEGAG